ncbi:MAG: TetR/AcrR family transcriptional regulator [Streptosporangiales bacterium]
MNIGRLTESGKARSEIRQQERRRRYDSPRRREQAEATRAQIAAAARRLFLAYGWSGTRMRDVAQEAGVAEPTVYAVYGSKVGLARALVDAVDAAAHAAGSVEDVLAAGEDPIAQLAAMIGTDRRIFERGGDVLALLHDAGQSQPELKTAYDDGRHRADQLHHGVFCTWPVQWLREGVDAAYAADTYAALCNIDVYRVLTEERGWSPDDVERWWARSLARLLLS